MEPSFGNPNESLLRVAAAMDPDFRNQHGQDFRNQHGQQDFSQVNHVPSGQKQTNQVSHSHLTPRHGQDMWATQPTQPSEFARDLWFPDRPTLRYQRRHEHVFEKNIHVYIVLNL